MRGTERFCFLKMQDFLNYILMIMVSFPSGECVNDVVNTQTNHQFTSVKNFILDYTKYCFSCVNLFKPQFMI